MKKCKIKECTNDHCAKGYCRTHYNSWYMYGDPLKSNKRRGQKECKIEDCKTQAVSKELCGKHYAQYRKKTKIEKCKVEDCDTVEYAKGFCNKHYNHYRRHGDPIKKNFQKCKIENCNTRGRKKYNGFCKKHYINYKETGDPLKKKYRKRKDNTSGYVGVSKSRKSHKWRSEIRVNGKLIFLGLYDNPEYAAIEYNKALIKYRNGKGHLNKVEGYTPKEST